MTQPGSGGLGKSRANVILRPRRLVPLLKLAVAEQHHPERSLPPQSTHCGTEGDPGVAPTGARTRAGAHDPALRAAEQGTIWTATRLGPHVHSSDP
jgi:hypothetical protein